MSDVGFVELSAPGVDRVRLEGGAGGPGMLFLLEEGVSGWYSSPDLRTELGERGSGDGAHDVSANMVAYASRTVELTVAAYGRSRDESLRLWDSLRRFAHRVVRLRLVDDERDAFVEGICQFEGPAEWERDWMKGVFTVVCARPEILATIPQSGQMLPLRAGVEEGGLSYNPTPDGPLPGVTGIRYPLTYYRDVDDGAHQNQVTLSNRGSSRAYPVFTVNGPMPYGVDLTVDGQSLWLRCTQPVYGEPLVLDCRSRTATVGGLDVSRMLTARGFPVIEPGGSITVTLRTAGTGWVDAQTRDTWM